MRWNCCAGKTLKHRITSGPLGLDMLLETGIEVADALDAAHAGASCIALSNPQILHHAEQGQAKVLDFGWQKLIPADTKEAVSIGGETMEAGRESRNPGTHARDGGVHVARTGARRKIGWAHGLVSFGLVLYRNGHWAPNFHRKHLWHNFQCDSRA